MASASCSWTVYIGLRHARHWAKIRSSGTLSKPEGVRNQVADFHSRPRGGFPQPSTLSTASWWQRSRTTSKLATGLFTPAAIGGNLVGILNFEEFKRQM